MHTCVTTTRCIRLWSLPCVLTDVQSYDSDGPDAVNRLLTDKQLWPAPYAVDPPAGERAGTGAATGPLTLAALGSVLGSPGSMARGAARATTHGPWTRVWILPPRGP